ncbi:MAG TPA: hypothetical protein VMS43_03845 [Allosphingosinicella sp.]|nr:hypothetical protein [Allosphingosinicella sp.]
MTKIINPRIRRVADSGTRVFMLLGADIQFTGADLTQGRSGAAGYELECIVWDDDPVFDDEIDRRITPIPRSRIGSNTSMEMQFDLSIDKLRASEPGFERVIELFGEFKLRRNGRQIGSSRSSSNLNYRFRVATRIPAPA